MARSVVGIVNMALRRIGVNRISALDEDSVQAIDANAVWEYIRDEVLEARDWKFAKKRVALAQNAETPANLYSYAYTIPADFLRMARGSKTDPPFYPTITNRSYYDENDVIRHAPYAYSVETLEDGTLCLFTNYDNTDNDLYLTYIKKVTNPTKYSAHFCSTLAFRLAAELCIGRRESTALFDRMMSLYDQFLIRADGVNSTMEYVEDDTGSDSWAEGDDAR